MSRLTGTEWVQWAGTAGLVILFVGLVFLAWWALFRDRERGRRRCPRCWYDMDHLPSMTCPECGYTARSERSFGKTRRRKRLAVLAMLGCASIGACVIDCAVHRGWMSFLPARCLLWAMPIDEGIRQASIDELGQRMRSGVLSDEQWLTILERCAAGDDHARPPGDEWMATYGRLIEEHADWFHSKSSPAVRQRVDAIRLALPVRVELATHRKFPVDVAPTIGVWIRDWWPPDIQMRVSAVPRLPGAATDAHVRRCRSQWSRWYAYSLLLPPLEAGRHEVDVELMIGRRARETDRWEVVERRVVTVPVFVDETLSEVLTPIGGESLDEAVRQTFGTGLIRRSSGVSRIEVEFDRTPTFSSLFDDTAVAVQVDVLRNGWLAHRLDMWWLAGAGVENTQLGRDIAAFDDAVTGLPDGPDDRWILSIRAVPAFAFRMRGATWYWAGQVTVPAAVETWGSSASEWEWLPAEPGEDEPVGDGNDRRRMTRCPPAA